MLQATVFPKYLYTLLAASAIVFVGFAALGNAVEFTYNGFRSANLSLDGIAELTNNGLLRLTNNSIGATAHAFHPQPINFKNSSNGETFSFSTSFVFAIRSQLETSSTDGLAFVIAPTTVFPQGSSMGFLGLFNITTNGSAANHIFAVELDTLKNSGSNDINDNHVAIDVNNINSIMQEPAGYYDDNGLFDNLTLSSGKSMQVWVDYDGTKKQINVTLAPLEAAAPKPSIPLLNLDYDLSLVLKETMYVGFSASTGPVITNHYILGWSFGSQGDEAPQLDLSQLPRLPKTGTKKASSLLTIGLPLICLLTISTAIFSRSYYVRRKRKFAEVLEDWEVDYGPHRFKYKDLYTATKGFRDTELLGAGGFGRVYRGLLPNSKLQIAVKRISHESRQGIREFVTEIVSIGRMSHRNLVPLLGYCRRKDELLLVYENMPNGSLDKFLYNPPQKYSILSWAQRFQIIKGVASGLFYLHEGWEQVVVHRDIKSSNVLLDGELNGRLGDFGLAKLYDHGTDPQTTHVVGTVGYLAPEHYRTGRATTSTDVYAFGAFLLEVVCGRRPIETNVSMSEDVILVEWVFWCWSEGRILEAIDRKLGNEFIRDEAELVLKLGLLCSNSEPKARPSMQKVILYLDGTMEVPELSSAGVSVNGVTFGHGMGFEDVLTSFSNASPRPSRVAESLLSGGR